MLPREKCSHIKGIKIPKLFLILLPPNVFNLPSIPYTSELSQMTDREFELLHYLMGIMDIPEREKRQVLRQAVKRMVEAG